MMEDFFGTFVIIMKPLEDSWSVLQFHRSTFKLIVQDLEPVVVLCFDRIPHCSDENDMGIELPTAHSLENIEDFGGSALYSVFGNVVEIDGAEDLARCEVCQCLDDLFQYNEVFLWGLDETGGVD
jgi:hypothetical protein